MEEAGTWWRTLGPFREKLAEATTVWVRGGGTFIDVKDTEEDGFNHCEFAGDTLAAKAHECRSYMIVV